VLTHFFNYRNVQAVAINSEYQPVKSRELDRVLTLAFSFKGMAPQAWQSHKIVKVRHRFNDFDTLDVFSSDLIAEFFNCLFLLLKALF